MNPRIDRRSARALRLLAVAVALASATPSPALSQNGPSDSSRSRTDPSTSAPLQPALQAPREIVLTGLGTGLLITGGLLSVDERPIPPGGLDPAEIDWSEDREIVGNHSLSANTASDWTRNSALAYPIVLVALMNGPDHLFSGFRPRSAEYVETLLMSLGPTLLAKSLTSRPRPYAYSPQDQLPDDASYDVSKARTFASMPSGHSSSAWTGAALGMTEELLSRPRGSWIERVGVGFVGGGLAGATSALRVEAGQHFPSDVIAGAGIGVVTGVGVPLLHRDGRPMPSWEAWLEMAGGALAGTVVGVAVAK